MADNSWQNGHLKIILWIKILIKIFIKINKILQYQAQWNETDVAMACYRRPVLNSSCRYCTGSRLPIACYWQAAIHVQDVCRLCAILIFGLGTAMDWGLGTQRQRHNTTTHIAYIIHWHMAQSSSTASIATPAFNCTPRGKRLAGVRLRRHEYPCTYTCNMGTHCDRSEFRT